MNRIIALAALLLPLPALADTGPLDGLYSRGAIGCDPSLAGRPGGPVKVDAQGLEIAGVSCRFVSQTQVSRMNARLIDATCKIDNRDRRDRFFIQQNWEGLTLVSDMLGTFILDRCGQLAE